MTFAFSKTMLLVFAVVAVGLLGACRSLFQIRKRHMCIRPVASMKMKSHPIGRFLVDLPEGAVIARWYQRYEGTGRIGVLPGVSPEKFEEIVDKRAETFRSIPHQEGGTRLIKDMKLSLPHSRAILYFETDYHKIGAIESDDYAWKDGFLYKFEGSTWQDPVKQEKHFKFLDKMFRSIRPLKPDEIPTEHGFCFEHSIMVDEPKPDIFENIIASAVWLDHPDVHFSFTTFCNGKKLDPPLLEKVKHGSHYFGTKVLRSGRRELAGGEMGEEHLERVKEDNGTRGHLFEWEAQGLPDDQYEHPQIRMDMTTGNGRQGPEHASLSDEDAMKVWDAIIDSIRLRPVTRSGR